MTVNGIYSSKPLCYSVYFVKILWTCCRLVPALKITDLFPNKIQHKLRQYSIQVVGDNQMKSEYVTDWLHSSRDKNAF